MMVLASTLQLADDGTSAPNNCRFTKVIGSIVVTDVIAIIPCTDKAIKSLEGVKDGKQDRYFCPK